MGPFRPMLALALVACGAGNAGAPLEAPSAPVTLTGAELPVYALPSHPSVRVETRAPHAGTYGAAIVGSRPVTVELAVGNAGTSPVRLAGADVSFDVRRGAVRIPCAARNDLPHREPGELLPGQTTTLARDLCSLPLPGDYHVDVYLALAGGVREHAGSFPFSVAARGPTAPRPVAGEPGLFVAMGGDLTGIRYTKEQWQSGAYHVVVRLTNASTTPVHVGPAQVIFRVTKEGHPLACSSTDDLRTPDELESGVSLVEQVPVTCVIDAKGTYDVHASLALAGEETPLGGLSVEVSSNPLLYLPVIPW